MELLWWDASGPYRVAFSTRCGGVSEGPYRSLNLGLSTADEPERVLENRRLLFSGTGADPERATMARQQHGADVVEASPLGVLAPSAPFPRCDGLWSREPGRAMGLVTADCFPVALRRTSGEPALCVLHVGRRGVLAGILEAGVSSLGGGPLAAAVGPGIGACCYEVGEEVASAYRAAYGAGVLLGGRLDLRAAIDRSLRAAGCGEVTHVEACTACEEGRFFSHRRDGGVTGRQGVVAYVE